MASLIQSAISRSVDVYQVFDFGLRLDQPTGSTAALSAVWAGVGSPIRTSVSIPDHLFQAADRWAGRLGTLRGGLYALALSEFVARHRSD